MAEWVAARKGEKCMFRCGRTAESEAESWYLSGGCDRLGRHCPCRGMTVSWGGGWEVGGGQSVLKHGSDLGAGE